MEEVTPCTSASVPAWERWGVLLVLAGFLAAGINLILHHAYAGQDFSFHVGHANHLLGRPDDWFAQDLTNRPLIYWIAVDGIHLTDNRAPFAFAAAVFLACNTGALWLLYDSSRRFVRNPVLRLAALALIALVPATLITSIVFAGDAMTLPPFALLCWSLIRWNEATVPRNQARYALLAGAALVVGNFTKFTFILLPAGVVVLGALAWMHDRNNTRRLVVLGLAAVVAPTVVGGWLQARCARQLRDLPAQHQFVRGGTGEMTWSSLLGLKWSDVRVLDAPGYWNSRIEPGGAKVLPLLAANNFSYAALLHLGIFTDVLDLSAGGISRSTAPRPARQQRLSEWAVRLGALFFASGLAAVVIVGWRTLRTVFQRRAPPPFSLVVWFILGMTWLVPIVVTLPFTRHAYDWGYWLPRLVMPGLWAAALCLFSCVDEWVGRRPVSATAIGAITAFQALLEVLSIWH
jgi:hypothetical protein